MVFRSESGRQVFGQQHISFAYQNGSLYNIFKLPDVSRAVIRFQQTDAFRRNAENVFLKGLIISFEEDIDQHRDVCEPLPQWRHNDTKDVEPVL